MSIFLRHTLIPDLEFVIVSEQADENYPFINAWTREQHEPNLSNRDTVHLIVEQSRKTDLSAISSWRGSRSHTKVSSFGELLLSIRKRLWTSSRAFDQEDGN
jgi:hypothetical protein